MCTCDVRIRFSRLMSSSFVLSGKSYIGYFPAIFAANRARVNNFPRACGTTSRKTMSADRGIEGEAKLKSNIGDFRPTPEGSCLE